MVVGITGGIGSGKTTILKMFAEFSNVAVYFADDEAKKLMSTSEQIKKQLIKEFTQEVYKDGKLNKAFLANIVFNDKEKLAVLNGIVHPVVHHHLQNFITSNKDKSYILYENAILFENGSDRLCDKVITVVAPIKSRIERVVARDKTTYEAVENRIKNQWGDTKKTIQSNYVINNNLLSKSKVKALDIHDKLTKKSTLVSKK